MTNSRIYIDTNRKIASISPLLFGGFAEHMGRCIYEGIYDPGSPHADENGIRLDVLSALKELNVPVIRYPGGNFVSGYNWLDGVGPKELRPKKRDLAWRSIETNQFGTNEFIDYCRQLDTAPMLAVNLGTGTVQGAVDLVEYCNGEAGSYYSDLRIAHGYETPHNVRYWCLGNEMDGPWQTGHLSAQDYADKAFEAAKLMKTMDPSIEVIAVGSSSSTLNTYPEWDRVVLERCWEKVDFLSMHYYVNNNDGDTATYLASTFDFEDHLATIAATLRYVKTKLRSKKDVYLSWDEWNVWYKNMVVDGHWTEAPHLIEEEYNLEDALVVAMWMNTFLRNSHVLRIACIAQLVNVIAPILTTKDGVLKQTIFYPFKEFSQNASGAALDVLVEAPTYQTTKHGAVPSLDVSSSYDAEKKQTAVFIVNRSATETLSTEIVWQTGKIGSVISATRLSGSDPKALNTFEKPDEIVPVAVEIPLEGSFQLPPLSFTSIVFGN